MGLGGNERINDKVGGKETEVGEWNKIRLDKEMEIEFSLKWTDSKGKKMDHIFFLLLCITLCYIDAGTLNVLYTSLYGNSQQKSKFVYFFFLNANLYSMS